MFYLEQIEEFEVTYKKNMDIVLYWDRQLMNQKNHDDWMKTVYQRSQTMREVYLENQKQLKKLFAMLNEDMNYEMREALYDMLMRLFYADYYEDIVIMERLADTLLPYYEKSKDYTHILRLLNVKCVLTLEYRYRQDRHTEKYFYNDMHGKLLDYYTKYKELEPDGRSIILANFYNMLCCLPMILPHELNYTLDIYDKFLQMIHNEENMAMDKDNDSIQFRIHSILNGIWNIAEKLEYFDRKHLLHFYELLVETYTAQKRQTNENILNNLEAAYYYTSAYLTERGYLNTGISWQLAYDYLFRTAVIYLKKMQNMKIEVLDDEFLMNNFYLFQETTIYVIKIYKNIKNYINISNMKDFIKHGTEVIGKLPKGRYLWLVYAIQTEWCENILEILEDPEEQQELINHIIVKGQIQTYIHSQMVALLAERILDYIISYKPELLLGLPNAKTVEHIQKHKKELIQFINRAAMYHDIGKSKISAIINQQTRALTDEEFELIKQHPEHPEMGILKGQKNFYQYFDIIAGHHKSYDGKSGYPEYFDNVNSPYRILIDLITICDCVDAATDLLGRNYAGGKKFNEVMQELNKGKGTQYNPDIVNIILSNSDLQESLTTIVENGRDEVYFQTYQEYFSKK